MRFLSGRIVFGVFLLFLSVIFLINNLDIGIKISVDRIWDWWPVIPLIIGLNWLVLSFRPAGKDGERRAFFSWGQFVTGLLLTSIGGIYLGSNLNLIDVDMDRFWNIFWPVVLILIAVSLIRGSTIAGRGHTAFMGSIEQGGSKPWKLKNGSYLAFMGGVDLDLTTAEIPAGETILDITAVMGGVEVKLPKDLAVIYEGSVVLGGVSLVGQEYGGIFVGRRMEHNVKENNERLLRVTGRTIMGGIEIKEH